jgi:hypothetical protein
MCRKFTLHRHQNSAQRNVFEQQQQQQQQSRGAHVTQ